MKDLIFKYALQNAARHGGKASMGAVIGKILSIQPNLKENIKELQKETANIIVKVNKLSSEEQVTELKKIAPELLEEEKKEETKELRELKSAVIGNVKTRIAPEPSKYLHIGHALIFIINSGYAKKYGGKCVLRLEDTNPEKASKEYVDEIIKDLKWLNIKHDEKIICSKRMKIYHKYAAELIKKNNAYACFCDRDKMKELRNKKTRCECANKNSKENLKEWKKMLTKKYKPGTANLRFLGIMDSDNGVLRDPVIFRISYARHYLQGNKYSVWPMYDFENAIEDSIEGITHVVRSKEFELREELQNMIKDCLGLKKQEVIEIGRFNIIGAVTKGREIRELIEKQQVIGWDDPRLVTIKALRRRGFIAEAFHELAKEVGLTKSETNIDIKLLAAINRKLIDKKTDRYFTVFDAKKIKIDGAPKLNVKVPLHPDLKKGFRKLKTSDEFYIQDELETGKVYRFMHLFNFKDNKFISSNLDRKLNAKLIHWLPASKDLIKISVLMPDGTWKNGLGEKTLKKVKVNQVVQFERNFFARCDKKNKDETIFWFTHS